MAHQPGRITFTYPPLAKMRQRGRMPSLPTVLTVARILGVDPRTLYRIDPRT